MSSSAASHGRGGKQWLPLPPTCLQDRQLPLGATHAPCSHRRGRRRRYHRGRRPAPHERGPRGMIPRGRRVAKAAAATVAPKAQWTSRTSSSGCAACPAARTSRSATSARVSPHPVYCSVFVRCTRTCFAPPRAKALWRSLGGASTNKARWRCDHGVRVQDGSGTSTSSEPPHSSSRTRCVCVVRTVLRREGGLTWVMHCRIESVSGVAVLAGRPGRRRRCSMDGGSVPPPSGWRCR